MRVALSCLPAALLLAGCASQDRPTAPSGLTGGRAVERTRPSPAEVLAWADLDENLRRHPGSLVCGEADGKAILGDRVLVLNGDEMVRFVRAHGYGGQAGDAIVAPGDGTTTEVNVPIRGGDGATMLIRLASDGSRQGEG